MPMTLSRRLFDTPVGPLSALASDEGLCAIEFDRPDRRARLEARRGRWFPPHAVEDGAAPALTAVGDWLDAYFSGASSDAAAVPLVLYGSPFETRVWRRLLAIAAGGTIAYGAIARDLGTPNGARAVGLAVGANPLALVVPCHRVVGAGGALTGYGGGLHRKRWLLAHERRCWGGASPRLF